MPRIYPIVNVVERDDSSALELAIDRACALAEAGISLLQLRAKTMPPRLLTELAADLVDRLAARGCALIVNDRADVAAAAGALGVHLGDRDVPVEVARAVLGPARIVGFSTHSLDDVRAAAETSADYIGFGPVFESPTKAGERTPRGLSLLSQACALSVVPVCAIGGITSANAGSAWAAGAAAVASISDFERAASIARLLDSYWDQLPVDPP